MRADIKERIEMINKGEVPKGIKNEGGGYTGRLGL